MEKLAINGGKPVRATPFPAWPYHNELEYESLKSVLNSGNWWRKGGTWVNRFEQDFAEYHGYSSALAVANGSDALEISLLVHGIQPGDEVIVPAFTFISTSIAVQSVGAVPIPVDIDPNNLCISPAAIAAAITEKTKAIIPVHMAGHLIEFAAIYGIAASNNLQIIQDAAHAHGSEGFNKKLGDWNSTACFSFQNYKLMTAGEGGIILFNDPALREKAYLYHNCGRAEFDTDYEHEVIGMNSRMNEFSAAVLSSQLSRLNDQNKLRAKNAEYLFSLVSEFPELSFQKTSDWVNTHPYYMVLLNLNADKTSIERNNFVKALNAEGIPAFVNYRAIYKTKAFWQNRNHRNTLEDYLASCPITEDISSNGFWIHHRVLLGSSEDVMDVSKALGKVLSQL